jgi:hypothetical protein
VDGLRDNFLAGAMLAQDKNVRIRWRDAGNRLHDALHRGGSGDEVGTVLRLQQTVFGFEVLSFLKGAVQFDLRANDGDQALVVPRLLDKVARAATHGLDCELNVRPCSHHDDGQVAVDGDDLRQKREPFLS